MASVLEDSDDCKITLEIVEDFINNDYDSFIQNEPVEDIRIIKWELMIKYKSLENKDENTKAFQMLKHKKSYKENLKSGGRYDYALRERNIDNIIINIQCNIKECFIKFIFYCDELTIHKISEKTDYNNEYKEICYNYLNQMQYIFNGKIQCGKSIFNSSDFRNIDYLKSMVKDHYQNIIDKFETYILYCKTEGIKIEFEKITKRIRYIKEYVKKVYDIDLI